MVISSAYRSVGSTKVMAVRRNPATARLMGYAIDALSQII
jgi:hypothetical protein